MLATTWWSHWKGIRPSDFWLDYLSFKSHCEPELWYLCSKPHYYKNVQNWLFETAISYSWVYIYFFGNQWNYIKHLMVKYLKFSHLKLNLQKKHFGKAGKLLSCSSPSPSILFITISSGFTVQCCCSRSFRTIFFISH